MLWEELLHLGDIRSHPDRGVPSVWTMRQNKHHVVWISVPSSMPIEQCEKALHLFSGSAGHEIILFLIHHIEFFQNGVCQL